MKNYTLLLDESGKFEEGVNSTKPSIVAGWLINDTLPPESWARQYLSGVKASRSEYSGINIRNFHGKDTISPRIAAFMTDVHCAVAEGGATIVSFKNEKGRVIVNSDVTYLNVLADGVIALLRTLLRETDDDISLHIFYAQREAARSNYQTPIDEEEYAAFKTLVFLSVYGQEV